MKLLRILAIFLVLIPSSHAAAGAWSPEPGHGYVKLWLKYLYGFDYHAGDGNTYGYGGYHEVFLSTYVETGIVDRLALVLHAPILQSFHLEDPRDGNYTAHVSPGDPTLSLRYQFLQVERFAAAVEAGVRAPFARPGPVQTVYATSEGNPAIGALQIGTGVWDFPIQLAAGYGWDAYYVAGSVGWVMRTDGYDHVLTWTAEGGTTIERQWGLRGRIVGWHSLEVYFDEEAPGHESPSGIGNGTTYIGFAIEGDYQPEPGWFLGLTLEGGIIPLVRQTGGPVITLYVARRF